MDCQKKHLLKSKIKGINDIWDSYYEYLKCVIPNNLTLKYDRNHNQYIYINDILLIDKKKFLDILSVYFMLAKIAIINGECLYFKKIGWIYLRKRKQPDNILDLGNSKKYNKKIYFDKEYHVLLSFKKQDLNVSSVTYNYKFKRPSFNKIKHCSNTFQSMIHRELNENPDVIYKYK